MTIKSRFCGIAMVFVTVAILALVIGCSGANLVGDSSISDDAPPTGPVTVVYVSLAGSSAGSGESPDSPLDTISDGIARAAVLGVPRVNVAEGIYDISDSVEMQEGISLYGGYSADFASRDPEAFETVISDTRTDAPKWAHAVFLGPDITNATVLDGFTVNAPSGSTHQGALRITGAPVVRNNILKGSISGSDNRVVSIGTTDGAVIMNNEIVARSSAHADTGIYVNKHAVIVNNIVRSTGGSSSRLISLRGGGGMVVVNNLIICGSSGTNYALHIEITGAPVIDIRNNIIYGTDSSGTTYGVYEHTNNTGPAILQQNNIFSVNYLARTRRGGSTATINNMTELNDPATLNPTETGGNIGVDMVTGGHFVDPGDENWQLSADCTHAVGGGGQDLSGVFSAYGLPAVDKQGTNRGTGSWSMGPYVPAFPLQPDGYTVSYSPNNATGGTAPSPQTKDHGVALTLATNSGNLARTGHAFGGWNTAADGSGTDYAEGSTYTTDEDLTLYAKWIQVPSYTVSYHANNATSGAAPSPQTKDHGVALTVATNSGNLARAGDTFDGWNTAADGSGTDYAQGATYTNDADVTLYAKWTPLYQIGDTGPAGGIVFHDNDEYSDGWRYLEAAPASTEWYLKPWGGYGTFIGGTLSGIGTGEANTLVIVTAYGDEEPYHDRDDYAAKLCAELDYGGETDWFLPSRNELNLMYQNLHLDGMGDFASRSYWSSSEHSAHSAFVYNFRYGYEGTNFKSTLSGYGTRAIRAF